MRRGLCRCCRVGRERRRSELSRWAGLGCLKEELCIICRIYVGDALQASHMLYDYQLRYMCLFMHAITPSPYSHKTSRGASEAVVL